MVDRQAVGGIRKRRSTLVGRNDKIGIVLILTHDIVRPNNLVAVDIVGNVQKT